MNGQLDLWGERPRTFGVNGHGLLRWTATDFWGERPRTSGVNGQSSCRERPIRSERPFLYNKPETSTKIRKMNAENENAEWSDEEWFDSVATDIIVEIEKNQLKQAIEVK